MGVGKYNAELVELTRELQERSAAERKEKGEFVMGKVSAHAMPDPDNPQGMILFLINYGIGVKLPIRFRRPEEQEAYEAELSNRVIGERV